MKITKEALLELKVYLAEKGLEGITAFTVSPVIIKESEDNPGKWIFRLSNGFTCDVEITKSEAKLDFTKGAVINLTTGNIEPVDKLPRRKGQTPHVSNAEKPRNAC